MMTISGHAVNSIGVALCDGIACLSPEGNSAGIFAIKPRHEDRWRGDRYLTGIDAGQDFLASKVEFDGHRLYIRWVFHPDAGFTPVAAGDERN